MKIEIDPELMMKRLCFRERICIRLAMFLIGMIYPAKYEHQLKALMQQIEDELSM